MRDPAFSMVLFAIEEQITALDQEAERRGLRLTDSSIRSLLIRAINEAKGKALKTTASAISEKDRLLAEGLAVIVAVREGVSEEIEQPDGTWKRKPISTAPWIACLEAIKESCEIRTGREPGSRGYLDYAREFIKDAAGRLEKPDGNAQPS